MASKAVVTSEMMSELGKTSVELREQVEQYVGEVTVDILSQNDSRFRRLSKNTTLTLNTTDKSYILPADFATAKSFLIQNDSSGNFITKWDIYTEAAFYSKKDDAAFDSVQYTFIEEKLTSSGPAQYITLNLVPSATQYIKFFYYRKPTTNDTDIITNVGAVKQGVRGRLATSVSDTDLQMVIYEKMKSGIKESPETHSTGMILKPSRKTQRFNRFQHKIGRGN